MQGQTAAGFSWFRLFSFDSPEQICPRRDGRPPASAGSGCSALSPRSSFVYGRADGHQSGRQRQSEREACKRISAIGTYNEEREIEPLMKLEIIAATTFGLEAVAKRREHVLNRLLGHFVFSFSLNLKP